MELKQIERGSLDLEKVKAINDEAFPPEEHISVERMLTFPEPSLLVGFYEGETLVGFSLLALGPEVAYLFLLAIDRSYRGRGYGSRALEALAEAYPTRQLVLDIEEITEKAKNYKQRHSRKQFYFRNGFLETGFFTILTGERYEVLCRGLPFRESAFRDLLPGIHRHIPEFDAGLYPL